MAAKLPGGAARVLFVAEHRSTGFRAGKPRRLVHVAKLFPDQRIASQRREPARSLPTRRRIMARTVLERELTGARTGRARFDVASQADDADIRRLLRETPMPG